MIKGGISKTRCATKLSSITSCDPGRANALPNRNRALSGTEQVNGDHSFADLSVGSAAAGVAGRLVMYSQKLINSFGYVPTIPPTRNFNFLFFLFCRVPNSDRSLEHLLEPNNVCETFTSQDQQAGPEVDQDGDRPLTLSQLSPQKVTPTRNPTPTPRDDVPISPLRVPTKRSNSVAPDVVQKRKKSKTDTTSADVSVRVMPKTRLPVTTMKRPKPISSSNSSSGLRVNRSIRRKAMSTRVNRPGIKQKPVFKPNVSEVADDAGDNHKGMGIYTSASSSTDATSASTSRLKNSCAEPVNSVASNNKGKSIASSSYGSSRVVRVFFFFHTVGLLF